MTDKSETPAQSDITENVSQKPTNHTALSALYAWYGRAKQSEGDAGCDYLNDTGWDDLDEIVADLRLSQPVQPVKLDNYERRRIYDVGLIENLRADLGAALEIEISDTEAEAALTSEGIHVWGTDGEKFQRMFAVVMRLRSQLENERILAAIPELDAPLPPVEQSPEPVELDKIEGFGASYWRHDDSWHFYSMPGSQSLNLTLKGFDSRTLDFVMSRLRAGHEALAASPPPQPLQAGSPEPVAWVIPGADIKPDGMLCGMTWRHGEYTRPLYAAPPVCGAGEAALRAKVDELEAEADLLEDQHADQNRMVDRIADLIGLPHDQELDTTAFELWFSENHPTPQPLKAGEGWYLKEEQYDGVRELISQAYQQGALDVHESVQREPDLLNDTSPEFGEAAEDHVTSVTQAFLDLFPSVPAAPPAPSGTGKRKQMPPEGSMELVSLEQIFTEALGSPLPADDTVRVDKLIEDVSEVIFRDSGDDELTTESMIANVENTIRASLTPQGGK